MGLHCGTIADSSSIRLVILSLLRFSVWLWASLRSKKNLLHISHSADPRGPRGTSRSPWGGHQAHLFVPPSALQLLPRERRELFRTGRALIRFTAFSLPPTSLLLPYPTYFLKPSRTKTFVREPQKVVFLHPSRLRERDGWPSIQRSLLCGICLNNYPHLNLILFHSSFSWVYTCAQVSFLQKRSFPLSSGFFLATLFLSASFRKVQSPLRLSLPRHFSIY